MSSSPYVHWLYFCSALGSFIRHIKSSISKFKHSSKSTMNFKSSVPLQGSAGQAQFLTQLHMLDFSCTSLCQQVAELSQKSSTGREAELDLPHFYPSKSFCFYDGSPATPFTLFSLYTHECYSSQPSWLYSYTWIRHHMKTLKWIKSCHPEEKGWKISHPIRTRDGFFKYDLCCFSAKCVQDTVFFP